MSTGITKLASRSIPQGHITFEEFCEKIDDSQKADLLDGVIYMASPDNTDAARLNNWLAYSLTGFVERYDLGEIFTEKVACRLADRNGPEPDILFIAKPREQLILRGFIAGPPNLVIEIVSPESVERDYEFKREVYQRYEVQEYWILDPDENSATFMRLIDGKFAEIEPVDGVYHCQELPGVFFDLQWLDRLNRPKAYEVLSMFLNR